MAASLYDSEKVRAAARAVKALSGELADGTLGPGRSAAEAAAQLKGSAATALQARLAELTERIGHICGELDAVGAALEQYAGSMEETGEKLKAAMQRG